MECNVIFCVLISISCSILYVFSDGNDETTIDPQRALCTKLLSDMGSSSEPDKDIYDQYECCINPEIFTWSNIFEECVKVCGGNETIDTIQVDATEEYNCCKMVCVLTKMEFLIFSPDPNIKPEVDIKGIIKVYMLSVNNDPAWEPIVQSATQRCFEDSYGLFPGFFCGVIPNSLQELTNCVYKEFFLKCPYWNQKELSRCEAAREYQKECQSRM